MEIKKMRVAILDLYDDTPNQGMRAIGELLDDSPYVDCFDVFAIRSREEVPDMSYDLYISTGGPGDPRKGSGLWETHFYRFIDDILIYNATQDDKKHLFLICHSFQMICDHLEIGEISQKDEKSFGIFPVVKTNYGLLEPLFANLADPFFVADFRSFQVVNPNITDLSNKGYKILALESINQIKDHDRALMAIRFSDEIVGTQFHPEADPTGMIVHFEEDGIKDKILEEYGREKYTDLIESLGNPNKIMRTHSALLPTFVKYAFESTLSVPV